MNVYLIIQFFIAVTLGGLIGLERGVFDKTKLKIEEHKEKLAFGGIRTFSLVSFFGAISAWFTSLFQSPAILITGLIVIGVFILVSYAYSVFKESELGLTTEIAFLITFFLGAFVMLGFEKIAIILTITLTLILSLKDFLNTLKAKITRDEISNTLKFAVISFVILPLLPDHKYAIIDLFNQLGATIEFTSPILTTPFLNPYGIWFFVVVISAVGYIGYILSKIIGEKNSIIASGAIGGLISSTAVTAAMTEKSKQDKKNINLYTVGTLLASLIMFIRVVLIVLLFNINLINFITTPALCMLAGMGVYTYYLYSQTKHGKGNENIQMEITSNYKSPFSIGPALKIALFVIFVKFISAMGTQYQHLWGDLFYYILGIVSGLADVDAISQTMSVDSKDGAIQGGIAITTILIAVFSNNFVKGFIAWKFGDKTFGKNVAIGFFISMVCGIIGISLLHFVA